MEDYVYAREVATKNYEKMVQLNIDILLLSLVQLGHVAS
jgi:hypothetical protein